MNLRFVVVIGGNNIMVQYIDKSALVAEIEKLISNGKFKCQQSQENNHQVSYISWSEHIATCGKILSVLDTLEVKEVNLGKELDSYFAKFRGLEKYNWNWRIDSINLHAQGIYDFAKYFFELGSNSRKI